jgi:hypothetical protein
MNRIAATFAIVLLSAGAAAAQGELVTRAEPAELFVTPSDLALLPAQTVTLTTGAQVDVRAADVMTARDLAQAGFGADESLSVTVLQGTPAAISIR